VSAGADTNQTDQHLSNNGSNGIGLSLKKKNPNSGH